jgi:putative ABC transport system ATP-binding protein
MWCGAPDVEELSAEEFRSPKNTPTASTALCRSMPIQYIVHQTIVAAGHPMLDLEAINKIFRTETVETHALRSLSLEVETGGFVAITGDSGSGKTTLLNVAGLLEEFDAGRYRLDGQDVTRLTDTQRSHLRNTQIGFIFQGFNLIPDLNIYDNVAEPLHYRRMAARERQLRVTRALEQVGLRGRARHFPSQLSGGQQQRAAIARAIAGQPRLILADEPTGNLDTVMSNQIMDLLQAINAAGTTIMMVTHNPELAQRAQRQIHIVDGQIAHIQQFALHRSVAIASAVASV